MASQEMEVKSLFEGTWKHVECKNIDAYLDAIEVGVVKKKIISKMSPTLKLSVDGKTIDITICGGPMDAMKVVNKFELGQPYKAEGEIPFEGLTVFKDGKLITNVTPTDKMKKSQVFTREIVNGQLVQTMDCGGVIGIRYFEKK